MFNRKEKEFDFFYLKKKAKKEKKKLSLFMQVVQGTVFSLLLSQVFFMYTLEKDCSNLYDSWMISSQNTISAARELNNSINKKDGQTYQAFANLLAQDNQSFLSYQLAGTQLQTLIANRNVKIPANNPEHILQVDDVTLNKMIDYYNVSWKAQKPVIISSINDTYKIFDCSIFNLPCQIFNHYQMNNGQTIIQNSRHGDTKQIQLVDSMIYNINHQKEFLQWHQNIVNHPETTSLSPGMIVMSNK